MDNITEEQAVELLGMPFFINVFGVGKSSNPKIQGDLFKILDPEKKISHITKIKLCNVINGSVLPSTSRKTIIFSSSPFRSMIYAANKDFIQVMSREDIQNSLGLNDDQTINVHHHLINIIRSRLAKYFEVIDEDLPF